MLFSIILTLSYSFLSFQSGAVNINDQPQPYEDADAYEVYAAVLSLKVAASWPEAAKTIVIQSQTIKFRMCLRPEPESERIIGTAISDYIKLNEKPWLLQKRFVIEKSYELVSSEELRSFEPGRGWTELSAVGFNADKTVAVVFMMHHCGRLCGTGFFHVLQKKNGRWEPLDWKGSRCVLNS